MLVGPLLKFLESSIMSFTIVVPQLDPLPFWWPILRSPATSWIKLGNKGDFGVLLFPSSDNLFVPRPLQWNLFAFRLSTLWFVGCTFIGFIFSVSQVQRPRIWRPAAPCPDCAYLIINDETNNFCQRCGFRKELASAQPVEPSAIDLDSINNRLSQLAKNKLSKPYEKQKSSLHREFLSVLASLPSPKTLHSATPEDILKFLVWKDKAGKTKVHQTQCPRRSSDKTPSCSCPKRIAAGTVDSMIGKLRAIFTDAGLGGEWDDKTVSQICQGRTG